MKSTQSSYELPNFLKLLPKRSFDGTRVVMRPVFHECPKAG